MATLSETASLTQKFIKYAIIGIAGVIFLRIVLTTVQKWWLSRHPTPPPVPTVSFGKLPKIIFPENKKTVNVSLETATGSLPDFSDRGFVYNIQSQTPNLLALDRAKEQAKRLGFQGEPQLVSKEEYRFTNQGSLPETLEMNITNGSFTLKKSWQNDPALLLEKNLPGKEEAIIEAKNFLQQAGLLAQDLKDGEAKVRYLKLVGNNFKTAPSLSEADFVRVDLFRSKNEELPFLTANSQEGTIYLVLSGSRINYKRFIEVVYRYFPTEYETAATYPLKSVDLAWQELEKGEGFISSIDAGISQTKVRKVSLAFFDPYTAQKYIQPVFVFEGDANFQAFVPAVSPEWQE